MLTRSRRVAPAEMESDTRQGNRVLPVSRSHGSSWVGRFSSNRWALLVLPGLALLVIFFVVPLAEIVRLSLTDPSPSVAYGIFTESPIYLRTLGNTFIIAGLVVGVCLLLGYPYAYVMHHARTLGLVILAVLVLLPFWSSLLIRTYAWTIMLQDTGVINSILEGIGLTSEPLALMRNKLGVTIGMSHILLPFMVLPLYVSMRRIDGDLTRAAATLGASPIRAFVRVFLPLTIPGIFGGILIVFVLALGYFITPALLGSPRDAMVSELVVREVTELLRFGSGSALALTLLAATITVLGIGALVQKRFARGWAE